MKMSTLGNNFWTNMVKTVANELIGQWGISKRHVICANSAIDLYHRHHGHDKYLSIEDRS